MMKKKHTHTGAHSIDYFAYASGLNGWNAAFKTVFSMGSLILCITADHIFVSLFFILAMSVLIIIPGKLPVHDYLALLCIPVFFMLMSGITIAFDISLAARGDYCWKIGCFFFSVTHASLWYALSLTLRALGAVSAMYLLTLTTPACEIVSVLRRLHLPKIFIELMYLIYRFIFILLDAHSRMREAAASRLGFRDFRTSCRSFGGIAGNLRICSMRRARVYYDAMLSRCYDGDMRFLEPKKTVRSRHILLAGAVWLAALLIWLAGKGG